MKKTTVLRQAAWLYTASVCSLHLLFPGFEGYAAITGSKWRLLCALFLLCFGGGALLRLELAIIGGQPLPKLTRPKLSFFDVCLLAFWSWSALSTLLSPFRAAAFWGGSRRIGFVTVTILCLSCILTEHLLTPDRRLALLLGAALTLNGVFAFVQLAGYNPFTLYPAGMTYFDAHKRYAGAFLGTVGNIDLLSGVFCAAIPVCIVLALRGRDRLRFLLLIPAAISAAVAAGMSVAGCFLGLAGGFALLPAALMKTKKGKLCAALILLAAVIAGCLLLYAVGPRLGGTAGEAAAILHGELDDSFGSGRVYIWRKTLALVPERPILGGGPDTLGLRTDAAFERYDDEAGRTRRTVVDNAHNEYLEILADQGVPALVFYLLALIAACVRWFRAAPNDPVAAACGCGAAAYAVQALVGLASPCSTPFFWLALGVLMSRRS